MRNLVIGLALSLALAHWVQAGDKAKCESKCATSEKIAQVLARWKAAETEAKGSCPKEQAKLQGEISAIAKACPIGSRMGETMAFVKSVLESAVAADAACAKQCASAPAKSVEKDASAPSAPQCEGGKLKTARTQLLASLSELSKHAACASSGACAEKTACCASKEAVASTKSGLCEGKAGEIVASIRKEECDKSAAKIVMKAIEGLTCEKKAGEIVASIRKEECNKGAAKILITASSKACASAKAPATAAKEAACATKAGEGCAKAQTCSKDLLAKATCLKASWAKVPAELKEVCPQKKQEMTASISALSQKSKAMALMPETVAALASGVEALVGINGKMADWAKANPDSLKGVSCEAKKAFETQNALIQETHEILTSVKASMGSCASPCAEKKAETASAN